MPLRAIIFDMDGVIIDSEGFWQDAQVGILATQGITITPEECEKYTKGKRIDEIASVWCEKYPLKLPARQLEKLILTRVCDCITARGKAMTGLYQALDFFHQQGYRLALATSSNQQVIRAVFDKLNLWDCFEVICSADDEPYGKPHPAVYLTTLNKLGLSPDECRVIEDSLNGFHAAQAAGIKTYVIAPDNHKPHFALAAGRYATLSELIHMMSYPRQPALTING